jgi:hypothetical protein
MGEARRRKQLDPNWGKTNRQPDIEKQADELVSRIPINPKTILLNSIASELIRGRLQPLKVGWKQFTV